MLGITEQIYNIIDNALDLHFPAERPLYRHKTSCMKLSKTKNELPNFDGLTLITNLYQAIENVDRGERMPSRENWHWKQNPGTTHEEGTEVWLERWLIQHADEDWANQVPTASGLVDEHLDKRRAIDLVHRCENDWYEFIELKVESDTPLFAAMEILQYGLLYIFSRANHDKWQWGYTKQANPLLYANGVHLKVLAPDRYYINDTTGTRYDLGWIENKLDDGLKAFLAQKNCDYDMAFSFESFTSQEQWLEDPIRKRTRVYPSTS